MIVCLDLRTEILGLLSDYIGEYVFRCQERAPAISILPDPDLGWRFPEPGTRVEGLEVVISRPYPQVKSLLGSARRKTRRWDIRLKQWDASLCLLEPIEALVDGLDHEMTSPILIPPNEALGIIEQVTFQLVEHELCSVKAAPPP